MHNIKCRCGKMIYVLPWLIIAVVVGVLLCVFRAQMYAFVSFAVAVFACVPFFVSFERGNIGTRRLVMVAVMTALSVGGRILFVYFNHFKPVTAIVVITGIYLGWQAGFICGAFSALLSGFFFGMGMFLPFQMLAWGLIGVIAAPLGRFLKKHLWGLALYGVFAGILFSLVTDIWTVLWMSGGFDLERYLAVSVTALPVTAVYTVSNVVFLLVLARPIGKKLERVLIKYRE